MHPTPLPSLPLEELRSQLPLALRGRVQSGRELERDVRQAQRDPLATGLPALERALGGGLPRGQLIELVGSRSSGRFSLVLHLLAAATSVGEDAVLIDVGDGLDPAGAARAGIDLARLLWLRPRGLSIALAATEMVISTGFQLVVADLGATPLARGKSQEAAWLRLARAARQRQCALLIASPYRISGTAASAVLRAGRTRPAWRSPRNDGALPLLRGTASSLWLEKYRQRATAIEQRQDLGFQEAASLALSPPPVARPAAARTPRFDVAAVAPQRRAAGR
jgi:hypothetical protein